jgi:hypothetical protein
MEMATCNVCGKIFGASSVSICPSCRKLLDIVYEKARAYLRDNTKVALNARELANKIGEDARLVEILMIEGRFENRDSGDLEDSETEKKKKKLLEDLEKNLSGAAQKPKGAATYGSNRHGTGRDR